jgi:hypothetical protein
LSETKNPGLNGRRLLIRCTKYIVNIFLDDVLAQGSTQATADISSAGKDQPFWDALNTNVKNLRAVISGHGTLYNKATRSLPLGRNYFSDHGNEWCAREPTKNVIFCFDKHSGYVQHLLLWCLPLIRLLIHPTRAKCRYGGYSSAGWGHGVRNIVFPSADPNAGLATWIRLEDGETRARVTLDSKYGV